ncbi:lipase 3-like isoform X1 [Neodiprion virginianus]|uniref:lipase 3-like isoform X1 n=2 Tax=Neodiprion virginianus TaxID=2961670 RepID=UPI001EE72A49|nr:lipase 3-like isoform X1 [Neodiprion virginianus]
MTEGLDHDEVHISTPELIRLHGYPAETHHAWTKDGYRLEMHRVPRPLSERIPIGTTAMDEDSPVQSGSSEDLPSAAGRPRPTRVLNDRLPVLVLHGLLSSSADFVLLGPQKALAYALCDSGYDVWLGNSRGNAYSQIHKQYTIKDKQFWDFSWHEMGYYDLPAMIDYILEVTGHTSMYYVGYSQGTTIFYVMASELPEYNSKIRAMVSLAPIAFLAHQRSPLIKCTVHFYNLMEWGSSYCNIHQWFPRNKLQARALGTLIRNAPGPLTKGVCTSWLYLIAGFGSNQLDKAMLPLIFGHFPAGSSYKQIIHYGQSVQSGSFQKFDYGKKKNLEIYGSIQPPKYNLDKVKVPVTIFYSENDFMTDPRDVARLADKLPNVIEKYKIPYAKFNHIDYLWGVDAKTLVYNYVIKILKRS